MTLTPIELTITINPIFPTFAQKKIRFDAKPATGSIENDVNF